MKPIAPTQEDILKIYQERITVYQSSIRKRRKLKSVIAFGRLTSVMAGLMIAWWAWPDKRFVFLTSLLFLIVLIFLVFRDTDATNAIKNDERLIKVNQHEIDALEQILLGQNQGLSPYDNGQIFADPNHPYASDLDLFGPDSLFQWMNRCHADQSKKLLSDHLKSPQTADAIKKKQTAVREFSEKMDFCQQFQSTAMANPLTIKTEKKLENWMTSPSSGFEGAYWKWFQNIYPIFPITICTVYGLDMISAGSFSFFLIILFIFHYLINRKVDAEFGMLLHIEPEIGTMYQQLLSIEKENYNSDFLKSLQNELRPAGYPTASASIKDLNGILKKMDWRLNLLTNFLLQLFFIWDLRLILVLQDWKKKNENHLQKWIKIIAESEVTISLASLVYNNPGWTFPEVDEHYFHFETESMGHPLIHSAQRIDNDFILEGTGKLALITGSNMAGKSTFLRSLGINSVLALMGSPVCARRLRMSEMILISSMRVADNLAENTSTFYAELKKLQFIIESVNRQERVFILLDEVLRGTNSDDRHKGSQALVRQLLHSGTVAVMATHDTDLAHSEAANASLFNYHFEGKIVADELHFDYKIKKGICESLNATTLMKKIGIHFQD